MRSIAPRTRASPMPPRRSSMRSLSFLGAVAGSCPFMSIPSCEEFAQRRQCWDVGEVEKDRCHRDGTAIDGGKIGPRIARRIVAHGADPIVRDAARIDTLDEIVADLAPALPGDRDAGDKIRWYVGKIDVDQGIARPRRGRQPTQHLNGVFLAGLPAWPVGTGEMLAERNGRYTEQRRLHRRGDRSRTGDISPESAATVDARKHEGGGNLGEDITYSGTVAAAMEATLLGVPS